MWISLLSSSDEGTDYTGGRISESAGASRGTCRYSDGIGFLIISISYEESPKGHSARGFHYSRRCREGGHGKIRPSQSCPRIHPRPLCQFRGLLATPCSKFLSDERICREPLPLETKSKTSSHVWSHWRHVLQRFQATWRSRGAGTNL